MSPNQGTKAGLQRKKILHKIIPHILYVQKRAGPDVLN